MNGEEIARRNDLFRRIGYCFVITPGVNSLKNVNGLIQTIREFDEFNRDNDPFGEHDFGSLDWDGEKVFWKIDYYSDNRLVEGGDPLSDGCCRVLTIMLAEEY